MGIGCNNKEAGIDKISSVGGLFKDGDTQDGVSDLSGNVWEWTNSDYHSRAERNVFLFDPEIKKLFDENKIDEYVKVSGESDACLARRVLVQ